MVFLQLASADCRDGTKVHYNIKDSRQDALMIITAVLNFAVLASQSTQLIFFNCTASYKIEDLFYVNV